MQMKLQRIKMNVFDAYRTSQSVANAKRIESEG